MKIARLGSPGSRPGAPQQRRPGPPARRQPDREALTAAQRLIQLRASYSDFLPEREALGGRQHSPLATITMVVIAAFVLILLVWSGFSRVEQFAVARGQVRPDGRVKVINHTDGGRVAQILVKEGDLVASGQPLFRLDPDLLQQDVARATAQWQQLAADAARLEAEANRLAQVNFPASLRSDRPDLVATQTRLFEARREALGARRDATDRQIEQRSADVDSLTRQIRSRRASLDITREQSTSVGELADKGYFPWLRYQSLLKDMNDAEGEVARLEASLVSARAALGEARTRRRQVDDDWNSQVFGDLAKARTDRDGAAAQLAQATSRLRNLEITAPDDGIIQGLAVNNIGQSIKPMEPLVNVVPVSDSLVIEAKVANQDIGYISVGQKARVKVLTYDFAKYGTLEGVVEQISPDGFADQQSGQVFYKVVVRTNKAWLGPKTGERPVTPGMQVDVDLITGDSSILAYLTDRMFAITSNSFREH
jgi:HlyD family type I secretion membrane fusion protein